MLENLNEKDRLLLRIIQRTEKVDKLVSMFHKKFSPKNDEIISGTRFQKCRRIYDTLLQEYQNCKSGRTEILKDFTRIINNDQIAELLHSLGVGANEERLSRVTEFPISEEWETWEPSFLIQFAVVFGDASRLKKLLSFVALNCAGFKGPMYPDRINFKEIDMQEYRRKLGDVLLTESHIDMRRGENLLHLAVKSQSIECISLIVEYAQESNVKCSLLDGRDELGQTPLHLAMRLRLVEVAKTLIFEGANLFIENTVSLTPLDMALHNLPSVMLFILDLTVSKQGGLHAADGETLPMHNIDFLPLLWNTGRRVVNVDQRLQELQDTRASFCTRASVQYSLKDEDTTEKVSLECTNTSSKEFCKQQETTPTLNPLPVAKNNHRDYVIEMTMLAQTLLRDDWADAWKILDHPVTHIFLDLKWNKMRFLLWTVYTVLRLGVYGLYIFLMHQIYFEHCPLSHPESSRKCHLPSWIKGLVGFVWAFDLVILIHTVLKALDYWKLTTFWRYFVKYPGPQTAIRLTFFLLVTESWISSFIYDGRSLPNSHYIHATLGILISSGFILEVIGNSNWGCSMYIHIYFKIIGRFLSVILTFTPLIAGFAISFTILFPKSEAFSSFARSLLRLIMMFQGEFDFENNLYHEAKKNLTFATTNKGIPENQLFWSRQILFNIVGCIVNLVLINLFLGYTVSVVNEIREQAEFVRRKKQIWQMREAELAIARITEVLKKVWPRVPPFWNRFYIVGPNQQNATLTINLSKYDEQTQTQIRSIFA